MNSTQHAERTVLDLGDEYLPAPLSARSRRHRSMRSPRRTRIRDQKVRRPTPQPSPRHAPLGSAAPRAERTRRQRRHRRQARRSRLITLLLLVIWSVGFRPVTLGGSTAYSMVSGTSMDGTYSAGDLVITRERQHYKVGDIVVFRVPKEQDRALAGSLVVHRIVGGDAAHGFIMKGDNRTTVDVWKPHATDIVGRVWIRVPHAYTTLRLMRSPIAIALFLAFTLTSAFNKWLPPEVRSARPRRSHWKPRLRKRGVQPTA